MKSRDKIRTYKLKEKQTIEKDEEKLQPKLQRIDNYRKRERGKYYNKTRIYYYIIFTNRVPRDLNRISPDSLPYSLQLIIRYN